MEKYANFVFGSCFNQLLTTITSAMCQSHVIPRLQLHATYD